MFSKSHVYLINLLFFVNLLTLWTFLFREYYIIYHHLKIYYLASGMIMLLIVTFALFFKKYIRAAELVSLVGISLYLAVPLSFWPKITSNPDVIKMLQLTTLVLNKDFQLAARIDYVAFPGFSYIIGIIGVVIGIPLKIEISALLYILFSIIFLIGIFTVGKYSKLGEFLSILFSLGFVYSFTYFSPQLIAQILYMLVLAILLNPNVFNKKYFLVLMILYFATITLHPETNLMTLTLFLLYFGFYKFIRKQGNINWIGLTMPIILLTSYMLFFASSFSAGTVLLKRSIAYLEYIDTVIFNFIILIKNILLPETRVASTSATIKPEFVGPLYKINTLYNGTLLLLSLYFLLKQPRKYFNYGIILVSTFLASFILIILVGFGISSDIGAAGVALRPAIGASVIISILIANHLTKNISNSHNMSAIAVLCLIMIFFVTFPSRIPSQEWNVHSEYYLPPLNFIDDHGGNRLMDTYYFLYSNIKSIKESKYIVLPTGQDIYVLGMSKWVGYNVKSSVDKILQGYQYDAIVYDNNLAKILWRK